MKSRLVRAAREASKLHKDHRLLKVAAVIWPKYEIRPKTLYIINQSFDHYLTMMTHSEFLTCDKVYECS
mgnify:CR=1 FL=1